LNASGESIDQIEAVVAFLIRLDTSEQTARQKAGEYE
jgi:hypothetical protein